MTESRLFTQFSMAAVFANCVVAFATTTGRAQTDPTEPPQLLTKEAGTWDCEIEMYFRGPQAPPAAFKGVEENTLVSGNKFLLTKFNYTMGRRGNFEGHGLYGYDSRAKRFIGTWVDNMTSAPSQINAVYDDESKTLTDLRTVVDGAGNEIESKHVTQWLDDSTKKLEIYMTLEDDGTKTEVKLMEMTAKKRKPM
jgi:hypothetical protein